MAACLKPELLTQATVVVAAVTGIAGALVLEAARLVVRGVRRRRDLAVPLLRREPSLDVVLLRRRSAEVAGGDVDHAVGDFELLHELLLDLEQPVVFLT